MKLALTFVLLLLVIPGGCPTPFEHELNTQSVPDTFYDHQGVKIHFEDIGKGRPLVFIHGFGASLDSWRLMVDSLRDEYRLVLFDLKGHGYSDRPADGLYAPHNHSEIILGLMDHLQLSKTVLVGHSLGSVIALVVALRARETSTDNVSAIVLITGSLDAEQLPLFLKFVGFSSFGVGGDEAPHRRL